MLKILKGICSGIAKTMSRIRRRNFTRQGNPSDDIALATLLSLPKPERLLGLLQLGQSAIRHHDLDLQEDVLAAIGELGTDESVAFIEEWLGTRAQEHTWAALVKGIAAAGREADPLWKVRVFGALEAGLDDDSNAYRFRSWPWVSWPRAMIAIDHERALGAFQTRHMFRVEAPGFASVVDAINESPNARIPLDIAQSWLPSGMPDSADERVMQNYLRQLKAHAERDVEEAKRRLWEVVERCEALSLEAGGMLVRIAGLPDPVWKMDLRIEGAGLENVRPAERTVWIVANWFDFPLRNGGFGPYATSYEANHLPRVIPALVEIGAVKTAACVQEWSKIFGAQWPQDQYTREEMVAERDLSPSDSWGSLRQQYGVDENVSLLNLRYQISNADQFERVGGSSRSGPAAE